MSTAIEELLIVLGFETDLKGLNSFKSGLKSITSAVGIASGVVTAAAGAFGYLVGGTVKNIDTLNDMAKIADVSVESLQELGYVAQLNGSSQEGMAQGLEGMTKALGEVARGAGRAKLAFEDYHLSAIDANGETKNAGDFILEVADKMQTLDAQAQLDLVTKLGLGPDMIQTLRLGSAGINRLRQEARDFGIILDTKSVQAAADFADEMDKMGMMMNGVRNQIAVALLPTMKALIDNFRGWFLANREILSQGLTAFIKIVTVLFTALVKTIRGVWNIVDRVAQAFGGWENIMWALVAVTTVFLALQLGTAIMSLATAIPKMLAGLNMMTVLFRLFNLQLFLSQALILAIPIAIGLLAVAIALIAEDIYQFATGGESAMRAFGDYLGGVFPGVMNAVGAAVWAVMHPFEALSLLIDKIKAGIAEFAGNFDLTGAFDATFGNNGTPAAQTALSATGVPGAQPVNNTSTDAGQQFATNVTVTGFDGDGQKLGGDIVKGFEDEAKRQRRNTTGAVGY